MERYHVLLSQELAEVYRTLAERHGMSVEQLLSASVHLYAEWLNQTTYQGVCDLSRLQKISPRT